MANARDRMDIGSGLMIATAALLLLSGCAGPTSPLGAPMAVTLDGLQARITQSTYATMRKLFDQLTGEKPTIEFLPRRQVLHTARRLTFSIHDPAGIRFDYRVVVQHNGRDVTRNFLRQAKLTRSVDGRTLTVVHPPIRLSPNRDHQIEVMYFNSEMAPEATAYASFEAPQCNAYERTGFASTDFFRPGSELVSLIRGEATKAGLNPAFFAALIAQESGFNPRRVSWARAMGLTQITPVADVELNSRFSEWPRYPGLDELPVPWLKYLVFTGEINADNDWRLDSGRSMQGGLAYLAMLNDRWSSTSNVTKMEDLAMTLESERTRLVLASYHSGYNRVLGALNRLGEGWIRDDELKGARRYVNRIFSYCDSFSGNSTTEGESDENETQGS